MRRRRNNTLPQRQAMDANIQETSDVAAENKLEGARRMVLIIKDSHKPNDSYTAYYRDGIWYYIDRLDTVSQKNFALLNQFLTIQASVTPGLSLQPTVSVGTH